MNLRTRISDLLGSKKIRSLSLAAVAALSWVSGSGLPEAVMTDGQGVFVESAYAGGGGDAAAAKEKTNADTAASAFNGIIELVNMIFLPATLLAGWLLSPDWTLGEIFGLRPIIHKFWVLVSNIVYVIFAFLLIAMAFMNIFGIGQDHYAMKKALPRFVTGILIVPFTWFIVSATLSVSNLLTASVLRLPADMIAQTSAPGGAAGQTQREFSFHMPKNCTLNFDKLIGTGSTSDKNSPAGKFFDCPKGEGKEHDVKAVDFLSSDKGPYGILMVYAYDVFRVQDLKAIDKDNLKSVSGIVDMLIMIGLWGLFFIVYALILLALVFALFTRAFYLWVMAIFSPLFGLFYYLEGKGKLAESMKSLSFSSFLSLALVPVYVSAALSFGLLFVKMAADTTLNPENSTFFSEAKPAPGAKNGAIFSIGPSDKSTSITVTGIPLGMSETAAKAAGVAGATGAAAVKLGATALGKIVVSILAIVVLWMAVMVALKSSEITAEAVKPIAEFGGSMGKLALDMPKYMPVPLGGGHKTSMAGLQSIGSNIDSSIRGAAAQQGGAIGSKIGSSIAEKLGMKMDEHTAALVRAQDQAKSVSKDDAPGFVKKALTDTGVTNISQLLQDKNRKDNFVGVLKNLNANVFGGEDKKKKIIEEFEKANDEGKFQKAFLDLNHSFNNRIATPKGDPVDKIEEINELLESANGGKSKNENSTNPPASSSNTVNVGGKPISWSSRTITAEQLKKLASDNGVSEKDLEEALKLSGVTKA